MFSTDLVPNVEGNVDHGPLPRHFLVEGKQHVKKCQQ